eukprot:3152508-Lingulodinium_polyedra.AAC.2
MHSRLHQWLRLEAELWLDDRAASRPPPVMSLPRKRVLAAHDEATTQPESTVGSTRGSGWGDELWLDECTTTRAPPPAAPAGG